jgi:hypothetical protein
MINKIEMICTKHGITIFKKRGIKRERFVCLKCDADRSKKYLRSLKEKSVEYKGGECEICGYNKCLRSLVFHHKDPLQKDFAIGESRPGVKKVRNWNLVKFELDKCQLLCHNCHNEVHDRIEKEKKEHPIDLMIHKKNIHLINTHILKGRKTPEEIMKEIESGKYKTIRYEVKEINIEGKIEKIYFEK